VKFCHFVVSLYPHILANFGRLILIQFGVDFSRSRPTYRSLPFQVSSFSASQIALTSSLMMSGPRFILPQSTGLSGLGTLLESYHKLQPKPKTVPELKMHGSWFGLNYRRKQLTTLLCIKATASDCMQMSSANGGHFKRANSFNIY